MGAPHTALAPGHIQRFQDCPTWRPPLSSSRPLLGPSSGFPMAPPPSGPLLPTLLVEDVQQLTGHNAANSAIVYSSGEIRACLTPRILQHFDLNSPTTSPIHHNICPSFLGSSLVTLTEWPIPGVARVEEWRLEESSWEDHHMVRYRVISINPPGDHLPPVGRAHTNTSSIIYHPSTRHMQSLPTPVTIPVSLSPRLSFRLVWDGYL